ncbi:collagen-binding domain-containing protein [Holzapfeliella sp. JNUCC 80]
MHKSKKLLKLVLLSTFSATILTQIATSQVNHLTYAAEQTSQQNNQDLTLAPNTIENDSILKQKGLNIENIQANNPLGVASLFHIFANNISLTTDTNGNFATRNLIRSNDFGTRGESFNQIAGDIYYIQNINQPLMSNAFRNNTYNHVILGKDVPTSTENGQLKITGTTVNNLNTTNTFKENDSSTYINFDNTFSNLKNKSTTYSNQSDTVGVVKNFSDMNNRSIDLSDAKSLQSDDNIFVSIPFDYLSAPQPITIKGIPSKLNASSIIINVTNIPNSYASISTQTSLRYDDGSSIANSESHSKPNHIIWNFGNGNQIINVASGRFMGSILAPNATINANVNVDGNIIADSVNISGGESHRWDTQTPSNPTQPSEPSNPTQPSEKPKLPQTGESNVLSNLLMILGVGAISLATALGIFIKKIID